MKKLALVLAALLLLSSVSALADFNETGLPITNETYTFSMMIDDNGLPEDKVMYEIFEEQTNVHVDLQLADYNTQLEKYGIAMSSGDYADVIGGWILGRKDIIDLGMGDQTFLPLEELFAKYGPNIEEVLDLPTVRASMTLPDGHIYSVPYAVSEPEVFYIPYINQVWLETLGLEMPTTPEEFKEVLIAFRDNDANGNGDATDEIPFSGDPVNLSLGKLAGWWGADANSGNTDYQYFALVDGKITFNANTDAYKSFIEYFADLYAEKLIDPELFTQDSDTWTAKGKQNLYGVTINYGAGSVYDNFVEGTPEYEKYGVNAFTPLPVLKGVEEPVFHRSSPGVTLFRTQAVVTDKCDDEKAAIIIRWFNNLYEPDNSEQAGAGPIGVTIEKVSENVYQKIDQSDWSDEKKEKYGWGNIFTQSLCRFKRFEAIELEPDGSEPKPDLEKEKKMELYGPYLNESFPMVWGTSEEDDARASILATDINTYVRQMMAQWISGEVAFNDDAWNAYCDQLNAYGLEELTSIYARSLGEE